MDSEIALYQAVDDELHEPQPKTPEQVLAMARKYLDEWFPAAMKHFEGGKVSVGLRAALQDAWPAG